MLKNQRISFFFGFLCIFLLTLLAYSKHFDNAFHFDDSHTIENNTFIRDIGNFTLFFTDGSTSSSLPSNQSYRPLVTLSTAIDYYLGGGLEPFWFHLSMFTVFTLQCWLMIILFVQCLGTLTNDIISEKKIGKMSPIILFSVAFYMLHPVQAETINYIISRSDLLSTFFVVLGMVIYTRKSSSGLLDHVLIALSIGLGMLAKPTTAMILPIALAFSLLKISTEIKEKMVGNYFTKLFCLGRKLLKEKKFSTVMIMTFFMVWFTHFMTPSTFTPGGFSRLAYIQTQPYVLWRYFRCFFLPYDLSADSDLTPFLSWAEPRLWWGLLFTFTFMVLIAISTVSRRFKAFAFGLLWFGFALLPTSSFIPLAEVTNDHRMYFPFIGLALALACVLNELKAFWLGFLAKRHPSLKKLPLVGSALILLTLAWHTHQRCEIWDSEESLWFDVTQKSPLNGRGWMNYGLALMGRGEYQGARIAFEEALKYTPNYSYLFINLGVLYSALGDDKKAESYFLQAIQHSQGSAEESYFYSRFLEKNRKYSEAEIYLRRALEISPSHLEARKLFLSTLDHQKKFRELGVAAKETLEIWKNNQAALDAIARLELLRQEAEKKASLASKFGKTEDLFEAGLAFYNLGDYERAIEFASKMPKNFEWGAYSFNLICASQNGQNKWELAIKACESALAIDPSFQLARNNLAWAQMKLNSH